MRKTATKERLSREAIVESAIALADAEGLEAVTIRRLAQDHGVTPMALYWHFKDKERLLDGIGERLFSQVELPPADAPGEWVDRLRSTLEVLLDVMRRHPALTPIVHTRLMLSEPGLDITERALGQLREGGFTAEEASQIGVQALSLMVQLVSTVPGQMPGEDPELRDQRLRDKKAALQALPPGRYPHTLASADSLVSCSSVEGYFDLGMDLLFNGIRNLRPR